MNANRMLLLCFIVFAGCRNASDDEAGKTNSGTSTRGAQSPTTAISPGTPPRITNRFGMTFCLVTVDPTRPDHKESFPCRSYYLQASELTYEQFSAYREAAAGNGPDRTKRSKNLRFPTEWRQVANLAAGLSAVDSDYDYRLPTRAEWMFACKNGYDQTCPGGGAKSSRDSTASRRPNKYGIEGFMNYDAECGADVPGLFLGVLDNWAGAYRGRKFPTCRCDQFTVGNPDADDDLNELVAARFVLIPKRRSSMCGR